LGAASRGLDAFHHEIEQFIGQRGIVAESEPAKMPIALGDWLGHRFMALVCALTPYIRTRRPTTASPRSPPAVRNRRDRSGAGPASRAAASRARRRRESRTDRT